MTAVDLLAAPGTYPVPDGRGRWRLTVHSRQFTYSSSANQRILAELTDATSRRLDKQWCAPSTLTFSVDGHSAAAAQVVELQTEVMAWRWDDQTGGDIAVFRGPVTQSEDTISEQTHTVNFTCHDYYAMFARRLMTAGLAVVGMEQDWIAYNLCQLATNVTSSGGTSLNPGAYLPLTVAWVNPDGTTRSAGAPSVPRDRTYLPQTLVYDAFDQLAKVIGGFDYDVLPSIGFYPDYLRVFYPSQGVARSDLALVYGSTVANLTRSVDSGDYANYWRVIGDAPPGSPDGTPPMFSEAWNSDANNVGAVPVGLWQSGDNQADVTIQTTLDQTAQGDLALSGVLTPTYTLGMRPDAYTWGNPNMGDTVPLVVQSGRLNVNTAVRVLGITYDVGDDGQEDVTLTVGRPSTSFAALLRANNRDIAALSRR